MIVDVGDEPRRGAAAEAAQAGAARQEFAMGTTLHTLRPPDGAVRERKRVGRGHGSGNHETAGRGTKGQKARTGHHGARRGFEGGQMPLQRRLPKRGFKNPFRVEVFAINLGELDRRLAEGVVDPDGLRTAGLMPRAALRLKILGEGELRKPLTMRAHAFSRSATEKILKAGGIAEVIPTAAVADEAEASA
jgi:large subunit ribosomal protein L15